MALRVDDRARPHGGLVRTLTLDRPERRNALDPDHLRALMIALEAAAADRLVRAIVITGHGSAFCAGYDLSNSLTPPADTDEAPDSLVMQTMAAVRACPLPIVGRVNGPAFGAGLELAISCDVRIAANSASLCLPPAKLGIAYAPEGLARLVSLVGTSTARRMTFAAEVIPAAQALTWRLVDEVVSPEELDTRVDSLANAFADTAPLAVRAMKKTFNALEPSLSADARRVAEIDRLECYRSADAAEGLQAFAEKRAARFSGR